MITLTKDKAQLTAYLQEKGWLSGQEAVKAAEKPGEGNMNFTLRIDTGERTFILKQSRPYVEKYPQVAAPATRVLQEGEFYSLISNAPALKALMPTMTGVDEANNVLVMDDLGTSADYTYAYQEGKQIPEAELMEIVSFAAKLHQQFDAKAIAEPIRNQAMRQLNHEHIFIYPYVHDNGLNLDEVLDGLAAVAEPLKEDDALKTKISQLGTLYLADGPRLLHGDYFPGSWLKTADGVRIIDPEFCFFGPPEFEVGVMLAHLEMAAQPTALVERAETQYNNLMVIDQHLSQQFKAIEILRRILGLAQLPLQIGLSERAQLVEESVAILKNT